MTAILTKPDNRYTVYRLLYTVTVEQEQSWIAAFPVLRNKDRKFYGTKFYDQKLWTMQIDGYKIRDLRLKKAFLYRYIFLLPSYIRRL